MTDKKKIILIYVGVALICVLVLGMSFLLVGLKKVKKKDELPATGVGKEDPGDLVVLKSNLELQRQDGAAVKISDLNDKVWLAAQFYATCPMCAERNQSSLVEIYNEFKDENEFLVVCFSVDPENDTEELLSSVRDGLQLSTSNWWFLRAEREKLWEFMTKEMYFTTIKERTDPIHIAQKGRWAHDMGYQLYRGDTLVHKWDQGLPLDQLRVEIRAALAEIRKTVESNESEPES
jgi:cytochrome oxidase Cu insertion factor (SCO1/SenC/PrrC family)